MIRNLSKMIPAGLAILAVLLAIPQRAFANTVVLTQNSNISYSNGGEFVVTSATLSNSSYAAGAKSGSTFDTFCVDYSEEFYPGATYDYTLGNNILGLSRSDPLNVGTAWLYQQFATGALGGYNYASANNLANAGYLQQAIWFFQEDALFESGVAGAGAGTDKYNSSNTYENLVLNHFEGGTTSADITALLGTANVAGGYGVQVIVTGTGYDTHGNITGFAQPQLYYHVPENGTTVALLGFAFVALVGVRRWIRKPV